MVAAVGVVGGGAAGLVAWWRPVAFAWVGVGWLGLGVPRACRCLLARLAGCWSGGGDLVFGLWWIWCAWVRLGARSRCTGARSCAYTRAWVCTRARGWVWGRVKGKGREALDG